MGNHTTNIHSRNTPTIPMIHQMHLNATPFESIANGTKKIEFRVYDEKRKQLHVNDEITFTNIETKKQLTVLVNAIKLFTTPQEMAAALTDLELVLNGRTREEWINGWQKYYTKKEIQQNGLIAIYFELLS